ncbi:hypothetical protein E2542_SST14696 [Spatholobus suberectus]|nr:hypothetical protein E2542_SST14696 [Spatholobus suberectus]
MTIQEMAQGWESIEIVHSVVPGSDRSGGCDFIAIFKLRYESLAIWKQSNVKLFVCVDVAITVAVVGVIMTPTHVKATQILYHSLAMFSPDFGFVPKTL